MNNLFLRTVKVQTMFQQLHRNFGGTLNEEDKEYMLQVDNGFGRGSIKGFTVGEDITYVEFEMAFSEDFTMVSKTADRPTFYFAYCSTGRIAHRFGSENGLRTLQNFQTAILSCRPGEENILHFEKGERLKVSLITVLAPVLKNSGAVSGLYKKLGDTFNHGRTAKNFAYVGSYNLQIADRIQQLNFISQKGMARNLLIEGSVLMILGLEIQQHQDDSKNVLKPKGSLTDRELLGISELSTFIENYYETDLRIELLSRKSGISPVKLQEGFKMMHGRTVTDHIRDVRIKKSEEMIKNTDLNITEIVYSIGFTSRSYFSKIFKQKYNYSPKKYRDHQGIAV
ncbi:MAG: AraC family transcriptional regulator [Pricia sp.]